MSVRRLLARQQSNSIARKWSQRAMQPAVPSTVDPEQGRLYTVPVPIGKVSDSVRLYSYHDIYGKLDFYSTEDLEGFYSADGDPMRVDNSEGYLISQEDSGTLGNIWFRPKGLPEGELNWNQPRDNTAVELRIPFITVLTESSSYQLLTLRFNHGGDKGGGANYIELKITPNPSTSYLTFALSAVNYGTVQDTDSVNNVNRTILGASIGYYIRLYMDTTTGDCYAKILEDRSGASWVTLTVTPPPGVDYCDDSHFQIYNMYGDQNGTTGGKTAIDYFRILKGDDEGNRITYKLSRDSGTTWSTVVGDTWMTDDYGYTDVSLSSHGSGDQVLLEIDLVWPALIKGFGLAWEG